MRLLSLRHIAALSLFAVSALLLNGCHGKDDPTQPGGSSPVSAIQSSVELLRSGDFNGLWKHMLPPADYANLRADWSLQQHEQAPITAADRARFEQAMQQLTGPDAENKLYIQLQPKLASMEQQYKDQLPVLISIGEAFVKNGINRSKNLSDTWKAQLGSVLDVLTPWARQTPWFDQAKAKQAVGVAVATARKLDLKSPEQWRAMDFDATMGKYSTGYDGLRQLLAIYGLSVDDTLDSVKLSEVSNQGGHAVVKIDYTLLGKPLSTETRLVQENGRWYNEDVLTNVRKSHEKLSQPQVAQTAAPVGTSSAVAED
ncbi:MAG TPA: hypothetical protein VN043_16215 [Rhodanobacter sp.]|nr:hypothetical protein [Rhodanobacter sp.]